MAIASEIDVWRSERENAFKKEIPRTPAKENSSMINN